MDFSQTVHTKAASFTYGNRHTQAYIERITKTRVVCFTHTSCTTPSHLPPQLQSKFPVTSSVRLCNPEEHYVIISERNCDDIEAHLKPFTQTGVVGWMRVTVAFCAWHFSEQSATQAQLAFVVTQKPILLHDPSWYVCAAASTLTS